MLVSCTKLPKTRTDIECQFCSHHERKLLLESLTTKYSKPRVNWLPSWRFNSTLSHWEYPVRNSSVKALKALWVSYFFFRCMSVNSITWWTNNKIYWASSADSPEPDFSLRLSLVSIWLCSFLSRAYFTEGVSCLLLVRQWFWSLMCREIRTRN